MKVDIPWKMARTLCVATALASLNSCYTVGTLYAVKGVPHKDQYGKVVHDKDGKVSYRDKPEPAKAALLPLTIPVDIVTSPLQLVLLTCFLTQ